MTIDPKPPAGLPPEPTEAQQNPFASPTTESSPPQHGEADSTGGIIPYNNPMALFAYYLGLFSLFPCLGILLAIPALILGILGLRAYHANPVIGGVVHAWIGIVMGGLMTLLQSGGIILIIIGANAGP